MSAHFTYLLYLSASYSSTLHLKDILIVPNLIKNLISISNLLEDNNLTIEFVTNMCFIKEKKKELHLAPGIAKDRLYQLLSKNDFVSSSYEPSCSHSSMLSIFKNSVNALIDKVANKSCTQVNTSQCHINTNVSANLLHQRLGHPNKNVLKCILSTLSSCSPMSIPDLCDACQYGKLH